MIRLDLPKVRTIVNDLAVIAAPYTLGHTGYIYRGEPECYRSVSSGLYRQSYEIINEHFDIMKLQERQLQQAREYVKDSHNNEGMMALIQHMGGKTNLIDFTTDLHIALYFACNQSFEKDGRVIFFRLPITKDDFDKNRYKILRTSEPSNMVDSQKSCFVMPYGGYIEDEDIVIYEIPKELKEHVLRYLEKVHGIEHSTVFTDLSGFIRNQHPFRDYEAEWCAGITAIVETNWTKAIEHLARYYKLNPMNYSPLLYYLRAIACYNIGDYEQATDDLMCFDVYKFKGKPELSPELKELLRVGKIRQEERVKQQEEENVEQQETVINSEQSEMTAINYLPQLHFKTLKPSCDRAGHIRLRIQNDTGYIYSQKWSDDHNELCIMIPPPTYGEDFMFWINRDGYRGINPKRCNIKEGHLFKADLFPIDTESQLPIVTVSVECKLFDT